MKTILITGGAGFIGSHLVDRLLAEGEWQVIVVDDFNDFYEPAIKRANISAHLSNPAFCLVEADIRDRATLEQAFNSAAFDCIVHLAARAGVRPSLQQPGLYAETNINGTLNLLELARAHNVKQFIFGSSSSVYGINAKVPFSEDDPVRRPISPYAATKAAGELLGHTYSHLYGIRCICLRFFTVYGARQRPDLAIHKFTDLIARGRPVRMHGDGSSERDYTYITDALDGILAGLEWTAGAATGAVETVNLGGGARVRLDRLIALIAAALNREARIERHPDQPGDVRLTDADLAHASQVLGFRPRVGIEEGIRKFVDWYQEVHGRQSRAPSRAG